MKRKIEIGIDSFVAVPPQTMDQADLRATAIEEIIERIVASDKAGLDIFGLGEHHRYDFLDSAAHMILAAAASKTSNIILSSAVIVLSAADPVRVFQNYATLDLISKGRAEMVVGRGSFTEAFPLFGFNLRDYDELFAEKLSLLIGINKHEQINWKGKYRAELVNQAVYPRPFKKRLPLWLGVGGTPQSFVRAGMLGLPLALAVIGGETHRFRPLVDLYKEAGIKAGHKESDLQVALHSLGFVANSSEEALKLYYPKYAEFFGKIGRERGWPPPSRDRFDAQNGPLGAYMVGGVDEVAEKIKRHADALGGISRFTFQMDAGLSHEHLLESIHLIGTQLKPQLTF
jgi:probable LLM family oxidoreductase